MTYFDLTKIGVNETFGYLNHRQFACHPTYGMIVAPVNSNKIYKNFESPEVIEGLAHNGMNIVLRVPRQIVKSTDATQDRVVKLRSRA